MSRSHDSHRVYFMTSDGWRYISGKHTYLGGEVPVAVHELYANEGWRRIVWQDLLVGSAIVYPVIETVEAK